jgi:hypothetical protein
VSSRADERRETGPARRLLRSRHVVRNFGKERAHCSSYAGRKLIHIGSVQRRVVREKRAAFDGAGTGDARREKILRTHLQKARFRNRWSRCQVLQDALE